MGSCFLVTQTPTVTLLVAYSNKHTTQGQGISHHHLHHNKTQKYHLGHSASSVPSPKSTHSPTREHTHIWRNNHFHCFHTPTHTRSHPSNTAATALANTRHPTPWCPARPPTAGWARPQFGWSPEFLTLGCEWYLFCECCAVRGAQWEVRAASVQINRTEMAGTGR